MAPGAQSPYLHFEEVRFLSKGKPFWIAPGAQSPQLEFYRPGKVDTFSSIANPVTTIAVGKTLLAASRAIAVGFFASCALVESWIVMPFVPRNRRLLARAAWLTRWSRFASMMMDLRTTTEGSIPTSGLLVSNHLSYLDIIVLSSIQPCVFVAKRDIASWPLFGALTTAAGTIYVDRERRLASSQIVDLIRDAISSGSLIVLFPEGTSSNGETVLPFKSALLEAVVQLRCEVATVAIDYELDDGSVADEICYWGDMTFGLHLLNVFRKRQVRAMCRFSPAKVRAGNRKEIATELREEILSMRKSHHSRFLESSRPA